VKTPDIFQLNHFPLGSVTEIAFLSSSREKGQNIPEREKLINWIISNPNSCSAPALDHRSRALRRFPTFPFNVIQSFGCFLSPSFYLFCPFSAGFLDRNSPSWPSAFGSQMEVSSVITFFESETRTSFAFLRSLKRKTTSFMALWHFMPLRIYGLVSVAGDSRVVVFESGSRLAAEQEEEPAEWVIGATVPSAKNLKRKN
jgi:hypothetical protein